MFTVSNAKTVMTEVLILGRTKKNGTAMNINNTLLARRTSLLFPVEFTI